MEYLTFSAPRPGGAGGNHTDHQHGCVLAAAIDRTARARVRPTGEGVVRVFSLGYAPVELAPDDLSPRQEEWNTTAALVRGHGAPSGGGACPGGDLTHGWSPTLPGSGLSSSAAFEVLLGRIGSALFAGGSLTPVEIAQMGQWAENIYFGKPLRPDGPAGQQHRRAGVHGLPGPRRPRWCGGWTPPCPGTPCAWWTAARTTRDSPMHTPPSPGSWGP